MIALDTNVLVRVLVDDGSPEVGRVRRFIAAEAAAGHELWVDAVVLAETVWVLETVFDYAREQIAAVVEALLGNAAYRLDGHEAVAKALAGFRMAKADFSDCLIVARALASGCERTATLDKAMRRLPGAALV